MNLGAPNTFVAESMLKVNYSFKYVSFTDITDIIKLLLTGTRMMFLLPNGAVSWFMARVL